MFMSSADDGRFLGILLILISLAISALPSTRGAGKSLAAPSPHYEDISGTEVVWQLPSLLSSESLKGVLFVAHGCSHGAIDFWPQSASCQTCIGLPEEMNITQTSLSRGYAVVAISSAARTTHQCWTAEDLPLVKQALVTLRSRQRWEGVPLYAMGASSGGAFVIELALERDPDLPFTAVCSQIMALHPQQISRALKRHGQVMSASTLVPSLGKEKDSVSERVTSVLFVPMVKDKRTMRMVTLNMEALEGQGVPCKVVPVHATPLTPSLLHEAAGSEISVSLSRAIFAVLRERHFLDDGGFLRDDPRHSQWRQALQEGLKNKTEATQLRLEPDASPLSEILNVRWAMHEIVSSTTNNMLDWFEEQSARP